MSRAGAAFFDLDRTLISGSSAFHFALAAWRNDLMSTGRLISDAIDALSFILAGASDEKSEAIRDRILSAARGSARADLLALNEDVIPRLLERVRPEAHGLLEMHAEADRDRYIVSASPVELVAPLAQSLGMEDGIGTTSEVVDGHYTGRLEGPFVYGEGKAEAIRRVAEDRGYDLRLCYGYSDSASDVPMLELVGHPVAVNPDRRLQAVAHQRGWPIVIFSRKTKRVVKSTTAVAGAAAAASGSYLLGRRHGRRQANRRNGWRRWVR